MTSTDRPTGGRPRLFVHVGIHKTGTTSLQGYLARHRDALAKAGLFVPKTGTLPQQGAGHHLLPWTLTGRHADQWAGVDPDGLWRTLAHELATSGCDHAIVSSEDLSHLTDEQVGIVAERLAPFDPVAVVVLRRPGDVLEGSFRTSVVIGGRDDFATYSAGYAPDYPGMLRRFAGLSPTGDLRIASYDDPDLSGDIVGTLLGRLFPHLALPPGGAESRLNAGIPAALVELVRLLRRAGVPEPAIGEWLQRMTAAPIDRRHVAAPRFLDGERDAELDAEYARQLDRIEADPALAPHVLGPLPRPAPRRLRTLSGLVGAILEFPQLVPRPTARQPAAALLPRHLFADHGPERPGRALGHIDRPDRRPGNTAFARRAETTFAGWAVDPGEPAAPALLVLRSPDRTAAADQVLRLERTIPRPDVAAAFPRLPAAAAMQAGFETVVDTSALAGGIWEARLAFSRVGGLVYADDRVLLQVGEP